MALSLLDLEKNPASAVDGLNKMGKEHGDEYAHDKQRGSQPSLVKIQVYPFYTSWLCMGS
jgi:hypothetical protein